MTKTDEYILVDTIHSMTSMCVCVCVYIYNFKLNNIC